MEILVEVKGVYGNMLVYPVCEKAKIFAEIAGKKTLTGPVIARIKFLGYAVQVQAKEI